MLSRDPLETFYESYPPEVQAISRILRALVKKTMPEAREILVAKDNSIEYALTESLRYRICYICLLQEYVRFGFDFGGDLPDPERLLTGTGKRMRHIKVRTMQEAHRAALKPLVEAAWTDARTRMERHGSKAQVQERS